VSDQYRPTVFVIVETPLLQGIAGMFRQNDL